MELGNNGCNTGFDASTGTLTLDFVAANKIEAGHAYIVKWTSGSNIENPVFNGVTVENEDPNGQKVISQDKAVIFQGTYNPTPIEQNDKCSLFLGENNTLYYPTTANYSVGAFRAYFHVDLNAGQEVKSFVLNFDDETGVFDVRGKMEDGRGDGQIYNIAGQRLNKPQRGINIVNGRKIVIK